MSLWKSALWCWGPRKFPGNSTLGKWVGYCVIVLNLGWSLSVFGEIQGLEKNPARGIAKKDYWHGQWESWRPRKILSAIIGDLLITFCAHFCHTHKIAIFLIDQFCNILVNTQYVGFRHVKIWFALQKLYTYYLGLNENRKIDPTFLSATHYLTINIISICNE